MAGEDKDVDFREATRRRWSVDSSGGVVEFQGLQRGQPALRFNLAALRLDEFGARVPRPDLRQPRAAATARLPADVLRRGEHVRASDTGPKAERMLVGTDEMLLLFDAAGQEIGRRAVATPAWAALISGDGRPAGHDAPHPHGRDAGGRAGGRRDGGRGMPGPARRAGG